MDHFDEDWLKKQKQRTLDLPLRTVDGEIVYEKMPMCLAPDAAIRYWIGCLWVSSAAVSGWDNHGYFCWQHIQAALTGLYDFWSVNRFVLSHQHFTTNISYICVTSHCDFRFTPHCDFDGKRTAVLNPHSQNYQDRRAIELSKIPCKLMYNNGYIDNPPGARRGEL